MPLGADTETCEGWVKTLCLSDGSHIERSDTEELLKFLWDHADHSRTYVWWNLGYDCTSILKPYLVAQGPELTRAYRERLRRSQRLLELQVKSEDTPLSPDEQREVCSISAEMAEGNVLENFTVGRWKVRVMGDKAWSIKLVGSKKKAVWSFDASKFFTSGFGGISLEQAARKYLGEGKTAAQEGISRRRLGEEAGYFEAVREAAIRYCIQDASLTLRLFERTKAGYETLGLNFPTHPYSKGSVSKQYLKDHKVLVGTRKGLEDLEKSSLFSYWRQSFSGGVFLLRQAGLVINPEIWDINSAYPKALTELPSLEGSVLVPWGDERFEQCYYQFFRVLCPPTPRTPRRERGVSRKLYGWSAEEQVFFLTGPDLQAMDACGDPYLVLDAVGVLCPSTDRPFAFLEEAYERKNEIKARYGGDSIEYWNWKVVLNGFYGVLAQSRPVETSNTNFVMASYVTALCRQQLWTKAKELEDQGGKIVSYATDGLVVQWPGPAPAHGSDVGTGLGEWSVTTAEAGVWMETGIYALLKDDIWSVHNRGLPGLSVVELQSAEGPTLAHSHASPVRYRQSVIQADPMRANLFEPHVRELSPLQSYEEGGMSFPREMMRASLSDYFLESWPLWLQGEAHEGEEGVVINGKLWRKREREEAREYYMRRSTRPLNPLTLTSMLRLGVEP